MKWHEGSFGYLMATYLGLVIAPIGATLLLAYLFSTQIDRAFFVLAGGVTLAGTWWRPWWFWDHPKAHFLRDLIGDVATTVVYTAAGLGMIYLGFFSAVRIFN